MNLKSLLRKWPKLLLICFVFKVSFVSASSTPSEAIAKPDNVTSFDYQPDIFLQALTIRGKVTDEDNEGIPGVNVTIQGTASGTVTDFDGFYTIEVPGPQTVLLFSFIGLERKEEFVGNRTEINTKLIPDISSLSEVVVIGYGSVRKSDLTGSISSIEGDKIKEFPVTSVEQGLQSRAPGIQVTQASGAPGGGVTVRIRGSNSINSGSEPLYVIDGFPVYPDNNAFGAGGSRNASNVMATLNPNEIQSIEVLKDASATAIYGSRGANGVVLITTKRGRSGETTVEYDGSYSVQQPTRLIEVLGAQEYAEYQNLRAQSRGISDPYPNPAALVDQTVNWQDEIMRNGLIQNHQLAVSGGSDATQYAIVGSVFQNEGIIKNSDFSRFTLRANIETSAFSDRVKFGTNTTTTRTTTNALPTDRGGPGGLVISALGHEPIGPVFNDDGSYKLRFYDGRFLMNPLGETLENNDTDWTNRLLSNNYADIKIIDGLNFRTSIGFDIFNTNRSTYFGLNTVPGRNNNVQLTEATRYAVNFLNENILSYNKDFNENHRINAVLGYTYQNDINRFSQVTTRNFAVDNAETNQLQNGLEPFIPSSSRREWELVSYISRINYTLNNKYLFTATVRRDGSSRFGENNKYANFPSVALGWRAIEESFIKDLNVFSEFKVRASFGITGNSEIPLYQSLPGFSQVNYNFNNTLVAGLAENRVANPDLKWETTQQVNFGVDLGFFQGKLNITADAFYTRTDDLLMNVALPTSSGFDFAMLNSGAMENKGLEFAVDYLAIERENFSWTINGNISFIRNQILNLGESSPFHSNSTSGHMGMRGSWVAPGLPLGVWKGLESNGIFQNQEEINNNPSFPFDRPGYMRYKDNNNDKSIGSDDERIIGDPNPNFFWGISQYFVYKNFDLNIFIRGVQGNDVRNFQMGEHGDGVGNYNQIASAYRNAWHPVNNPAGTRPIIDATREFANFYRNSDFFIEDGSFIRLQNVALGYNLNNIKFAQSVRFFVSGQNLFLITKYSGFDPEVNNQGQSNLNRGDDYDAYPRARTFTAGINVKF